MDDVGSLSAEFVPADFVVPRTLQGGGFVLEPLGPEHNDSDHAAWSGSIDHIHATPGFTAALWQGDDWPYPMSSEQNLADLQMHAREFAAREAFAYSVLADHGADSADVIGCVYVDPDPDAVVQPAAMVRCWVRADHADLDGVLAATVAEWLQRDWPFAGVRFPGRGGSLTG
ncbi:MAG: N-acetyltransferase [Actinomycetota bacterium]|jgi:hypothetical protein